MNQPDPSAAATAMNLPPDDALLPMLDAAIGQIEFARRYTLEMLTQTPTDRWYEFPPGLPTSIAWQIGHLAVSQYGLLMFRIRGRLPEDLELVPGRFRKAYGRGSVPTIDRSSQPEPDELTARLDQIHTSGLAELRRLAADPAAAIATLRQGVDMPYAAFPIKLGAILFCPLHEQTHAGHIGLLRRAMGLEPIR